MREAKANTIVANRSGESSTLGRFSARSEASARVLSAESGTQREKHVDNTSTWLLARKAHAPMSRVCCAGCSHLLQLDESWREKGRLQDVKTLVSKMNTDRAPPPPDTKALICALHAPQSLQEAMLTHVKACGLMGSDKENCSAEATTQRGFSSLESHTSGSPELFALLNISPADSATPALVHPLCQDCAHANEKALEDEHAHMQCSYDTLALLAREMERLALIDGDLEMSPDEWARWQRERDALFQDLDHVRDVPCDLHSFLWKRNACKNLWFATTQMRPPCGMNSIR